MFIDARIPLRFAPIENRAQAEAVITDSDAPVPEPCARFDPIPAATHPVDCACCQPRTAAAQALAALLRARAIAPGPAFKSVLAAVSPSSEAAIRAALETDPLVSARYRLA